jgi:hypothetical protein
MAGLDITDNYIRARQVDPSAFEEGSFRTIRLTSGIKAIIGNKKGEKSTSVQSVLFDKKRYTPEKAQAWLSKHNEKFSDAVMLEQKKTELFALDPMEAHMEGHLPSLSPSQIEKLLELCGPAEEEDDEESEDETSENSDFSQIAKYVRLV